MRLGSGICPVRVWMRGQSGHWVDGSANGDTGHVINEARTAIILQQRVKNG
ncbi:MAG: hypothetical protein U0401_27930 [Anaerolineae bacterium]